MGTSERAIDHSASDLAVDQVVQVRQAYWARFQSFFHAYSGVPKK